MIVVGVDGSPAADAALRWAIRQAARERGTVQAVAVREHPASAPPAGPPRRTGTVAAHAAPLERLRAEVDAARAALPAAPSVVEVTPTGDPAEELVRSADDADLLVLGAHGPGGRRERVGGVTLACLRRARCPVVVITSGAAERLGAPPRPAPGQRPPPG
ncbi:universal stress protein [Gandjariella thermophila]|uniref:Universal stress protein n=1 Tax=Gandjariella thermophila TaxID=1931992 RepID=A0A4D4J015_9PSEU|nr:universal stress protein [Gandjariella thermophila]